MKKNKATKVYGLIGKGLCGLAGGILGFVTGGIGLAFAGILPGILAAHLMEKSVAR